MDEIQSKLQGDRDLRELSKDFLLLSYKAAATNHEQVVAAWTSMSMRMVDGYTFAIDDGLREAERRLVIRAMDLLGGKFGSEKDASSAIWEAATKHLETAGEATKEDVAALIAALTAHTEIEVECVLPNRLVHLSDDVDSVHIGPVRIERGADVVVRLNAKAPKNLTFGVGPKPGLPHVAGRHLVSDVNQTCWCVDMSAAPSNFEEEAVWLVDIAVSLLRLAHEKVTPLFPGLGEVEPHSCEAKRHHNEMIVGKANGISVGGTVLRARYEVTPEVVGWLGAEQIQKWAKTVFDPPKGSVAERIHAGLGWLSRGRQANGRAERLLFSFTALEALLTDDDKNTPIVQTVARHLAVLLENDPEKRIVRARDLRRLYGRRSALVHMGRRDVSKGSAGSVQMFAEAAYHRVLREVNPTMSLKSFHQGLSEASYGLPWPPVAKDD